MNWTDFGIGFGCCALLLNMVLAVAAARVYLADPVKVMAFAYAVWYWLHHPEQSFRGKF